MREKKIDKTGRLESIISYINSYYDDFRKSPSIREISSHTGIPVTSVHRYMELLDARGEMDYDGRNRNSSTKRIRLEGAHSSMPVLGYVSCGTGDEEEEQVIEYIRMPESLTGKGEFFALIAKGESMIEAGIYPGDHVIIRKQNYSEPGRIIVAFYNGLNNLKKLVYENNKCILRSCNPDKEKYPDIYTDELQIQGVAVGVYHSL